MATSSNIAAFLDHRPQRLLLFVSLVLAVTLSAVACTKKKGRKGLPAPGATPSETTTTVPSDIVDDVGEDVPPITSDNVSTIDTEKQAALKRLTFSATDSMEASRHRSEFLLVVRANEASCIRLKVRPTDGIDSEIDDANFDQEEDTACAAPKEFESDETDNSGAGSGSGSGTGSLRMWSGDDGESINPALLDWGQVSDSPADSLNLTGFALNSTPAPCSLRLFRMRQASSGAVGSSSTLEGVVTKTGRLAYSNSRVRVWVDSEMGNPCVGATAGSLPRIPFAPLTRVTEFAGHVDQLTIGHLQTMGDETAKTIEALTATFGNLSDIDKSGTVDLFVSPDVNRTDFIERETNAIDNFRIEMRLKPQDLARYNSQTNPASNEGEIIYMWAPDPAGLYNYANYPSANSLTSNYAIGHIAAQVMSLILTNKRLLERKDAPMEERWLVGSLAYLASAYRGGNDYTFTQLSHYLTSRPQNISLTETFDPSQVAPEYASIASDEAAGMRVMFGWYLHSRICGPTALQPCAGLKALLENKKNGKANIEDLLGEPFEKTMRNFGLSVGIALTERPTVARAFWQQPNLPADFPAAPADLPVMTEIRTNDPPLTWELDNEGNAVFHTPRGADTTGRQDRAQVSPFPSRDTLLFQPIFPDNDMDLKLAKDSVTFIVVTGLIEKDTEVTATLGKSLNVVFIPLGERSSSDRQVHVEKVSEHAHRDLRPVNLTQTVDAERTYFQPPEYPAGVDMSVTPSRELWVVGSIDNFTVNVEGASVPVGDTDAYNIEVSPCRDLTGTALTACQARDHQVMIQITPRDFPKELAPMILAANTRLGLYRGATVLARVTDLDPTFNPGGDQTNQRHFLCQSAQSWNGAESPNACANGGVLPSAYMTECGAFSADFACQTSGQNQASMFDAIGFGSNSSFSTTFDNFFHSGPEGFPYLNDRTMAIVNPPPRIGMRSFRPYEVARQFHTFGYSADLVPRTLNFHAVPRNFNTDPRYVNLTTAEINNLLSIRSQYLTGAGAFDPGQADSSEAFQQLCTPFAPLDACTKPQRNPDLNTAVLASLRNPLRRITCYNQTSCFGSLLGQTSGTLIEAGSEWIDPNFIVAISSVPLEAYTTHYVPLEPTSTSSTQFCAGAPTATRPTTHPECRIKAPELDIATDIRMQFNVPSSRFSVDCDLEKFGEDFDVCGDWHSFREETNAENANLSTFINSTLSTDRKRNRCMATANRAGEVIGKPNRLHYLHFTIPGSRASTIVNVMVGGRNLSQGKYLLRTRITTFEPRQSGLTCPL